jgi:hypothetical protein
MVMKISGIQILTEIDVSIFEKVVHFFKKYLIKDQKKHKNKN